MENDETAEVMWVKVKDYEAIEDGINVRSMCEFVKNISDFSLNLFRIHV